MKTFSSVESDTVVPFHELEKVRTHVSLPRTDWVMSGETLVRLAKILDHFKSLDAEIVGLGPHPEYANDYIVRAKMDGWVRDFHISMYRGRASEAEYLMSVGHKDIKKIWSATPQIYKMPVEDMIDKLPLDSAGNTAPAVILEGGRLALDTQAENYKEYVQLHLEAFVKPTNQLQNWVDEVGGGYWNFVGDNMYLVFIQPK